MLIRILVLLLGAIPASILTTWIYNGTGRSLLLVVLFNNSVKVTDLFITPAAAGPAITIAAFWIVALVILRLAGTQLGSRPVRASSQVTNLPAAESKLPSSLPSRSS